MTTLWELRDSVRKSGPEDWNKIEDGPTYRSRFASSRGPGNEWRREEDSHRTIAVYIPDVDLTIAYGMDFDFDWGDQVSHGWVRVPPRAPERAS
jgi:hypothetical protein